MNKFGLVLIMLLLSCSNRSVYESKTFKIMNDSVVQGNAKATAVSSTEMFSTYKSDYKKPTRRLITFKLSINGLDNERSPGEDHHLFIDPQNGKFVSEIFIFGKPDPGSIVNASYDHSSYLEKDVKVTIRVDMRDVLTEFRSQGYFTTYDGNSIKYDEFEGLYIAGDTHPLTWEFTALTRHPEYRLSDSDKDGIYEITLWFPKFHTADEIEAAGKRWRLLNNLTAYPRYESPIPLMTSLHSMSLEEMMLDIRDDGAFMAGAKWPGVWTRDISYSILLSLAFVDPEASKKSLIAKVNHDRIIQDTGTGGSWPISSDRMTWALAAWEIYLVTGDSEWLHYSYEVIKNSVCEDFNTVFDDATDLFSGESSFLDWREQTYPRWMDPKDIYQSLNLGTNAVHQRTLEILAEMAELLGHDPVKFDQMADRVKAAMNDHLWICDKGFYGQYIYGRINKVLSRRSETLGEALCVLFDIADEQKAKSILANVPVLEYGPPCVYPQIQSIPPYHNDGIWPFVAGYWTWAGAKVGNYQAVEHGLASIYRPAALFLTNKENIVATTGDYLGTEINSDRQLWSVAANLATIYRVIYGMRFTLKGLYLNPFIPPAYGGTHILDNFRYRGALLTIRIEGSGNEIQSILLDDELVAEAFLSSDLKGKHNLVIRLNNKVNGRTQINRVENKFAPETPLLYFDGDRLIWTAKGKIAKYVLYRNGERLTEISCSLNDYPVTNDGFTEYQLMAVDENGLQSFLSEPITVFPEDDQIIIEPMNGTLSLEGADYTKISKTENRRLSFSCMINVPGKYTLDFRYANGNGPINTDNKCAIRSLFVDGERFAAFVFPQRGSGFWDDWGYSNSRIIELKAGKHVFELRFTESDENMNVENNTALLDHLRLIRITDTER